MANMDPQIRLLGAIKREIRKIVTSGKTLDDRKMLIDFAERELAALKAEIEQGK